MKYFGWESIDSLIEEAECNAELYYKRASYLIWPDEIGYHIAMDSFDCKETTADEMNKSTMTADTVMELIDKYVLYDGTKLSEAMEMDIKDLEWDF